MELSNCDEIPSCKILYFVEDTALLADLKSQGCTIDQKVVAVQGSLCGPTPLMLIHSFVVEFVWLRRSYNGELL
jgi:hypothetical protein